VPKIILTKVSRDLCLAEDQLTVEFLEAVKLGGIIHGNFSKMRNAAFHRKFFAMLNVGYESFEPDLSPTQWGVPQKNIEMFREHVLCLAGFGDLVIDLNGRSRMKAQSISFSSMDQAQFERVYSKVADVILEKVLTSYTRKDLDNVVSIMMEFVK